jgi:hypothetical protein
MKWLIPNHGINKVSGVEGISYGMMSWQKILQVCVLGIAMVYTLALVETDSMD